MSPYVSTVLRIIGEADEPVGWYHIERQLSNVAFGKRLHLPDVLKELVRKRLISIVHFANTPEERYELTFLGAETVRTLFGS